MTGNEDGGFKPHPGDPWHPEWTSDDLEQSEALPASPPEEQEETGRRRRSAKKPKKRSKRKGKTEDAPDEGSPDEELPEEDAVPPDEDATADEDAVAGVQAAFDPAGTALDAPDALPNEDKEADAFEQVLEREGEQSRREDSADVPPPAWTVDDAPSDGQALPVEPPSWAGSATGSEPGVEAVGFEPVSAAETEAAEIDAVGFEPVSSDEAVSFDDVEGAEPEAAATDVAAMGDAPGEIAGVYGVAGAEAYEALDGGEEAEPLDDWEAFMDGGAPPPPPPPPPAPAVEPPKKRRGRWRRRRKDTDDLVEAAEEPAPMGEVPAPSGDYGAADMLPGRADFEGPTGDLDDGDAFDDWVASAETEPRRRGLFRRSREADLVEQPIEDEPYAEYDTGFDADSMDALGLEGAIDEMVTDLTGEFVAPAVVDTPRVEEPLAVEEAAAVEELMAVEEPAVVEEPAPVEEPVLEEPIVHQPDLFAAPDDETAGEPSDWSGDGGRVPDAWLAEIDEDVVSPPPEGADLIEEPLEEGAPLLEAPPEDTVAGFVDEIITDTPASVEEPPEHLTPGDVFDVAEEDAVERPVEPVAGPVAGYEVDEVVEPVVEVPPGYEIWEDAVDEALAGADDLGADEATYEYDQPPALERAMPESELPAGFERFPGEMEEFQISQEELDAELGTGDTGWVTSAVDPDPGSEELQLDEIDEAIYARGGTIEHRDLAAAIAEAGEEDTQWHAISAAMPGLETGVLGFEDVADLGAGDEYVEPVTSNLGTRVGTGIILLGVLFGTLLWAPVAFSVFIGLMVMLGLVEFYAALRRSGYLPLTLFGIIGGAATLFATWFHGPMAIPVGVLLTSMLTFLFYAFSPTRRDALANGGLTVLGIGWIVATIGFVIPISRAEEYVPLIVAVVAVTAAMDVGAFSFGRTWGRSPLAPILSPNKTAEGLIGGVLLALGAAAGVGFLGIGPFELGSALALGAVVVVLAPLGDLAESMIKRSLGIKDMGSTLPGHGGVLDRIDAFLFVVPAAWVLFELSGHLG